MSRGGSVSSVMRLQPGWPRIRSSILSRNNRSLFHKEPPPQFLPRGLSPVINRPAKDDGHLHLLLRFRMIGDMPPPPTHHPAVYRETQFHWYFKISATIFTFPSVLLSVSKTRRINSFVDLFFGHFLPHFFRFKQQFGVQPSTTSWRKAKWPQNLSLLFHSTACKTRTISLTPRIVVPKLAVYFPTLSGPHITQRRCKNQWRTMDWKGTEVVVAYSTRLLAVGYM